MPGFEQMAAMVGKAGANAVQFAKAGYDVFDSIRKSRAANKILKNTKRPIYRRPGEVDNVADLATNELQSNALQDYATQQANQGLSAGIDAVLKSGGKADFNTIYSTYGNSLAPTIQMIQRDRANKIASYNTAQYNLGRAKDAEWQYNVDAPYKDAMQQAALLKEQAAKARGSAFTNLSGAFATAATANTKPGDFPDSSSDNGVSSDRTMPESILLSRRTNTLPTTIPDRNAGGTNDALLQQFNEWLNSGGPNLERI